jgi:hypothetical protein
MPDEHILYRGATSRGDDSGRAAAESDALDQVAGGARATYPGSGRNDRPTCHHVPGGTGPRGAFLRGLNGQSGLETVMAYHLMVVGIPAERRRAVVEGMMLTAGEAGLCEEPAVHPTVGHRVLTHPAVRAQDIDVLAKVSGPVGADERMLVTPSADLEACIGMVRHAVALQDIGRRATGDGDAVPGVPGRVPVVMPLVVDEAMVVGALQPEAAHKLGHLAVLHRGPGCALRQRETSNGSKTMNRCAGPFRSSSESTRAGCPGVAGMGPRGSAPHGVRVSSRHTGGRWGSSGRVETSRPASIAQTKAALACGGITHWCCCHGLRTVCCVWGGHTPDCWGPRCPPPPAERPLP